MTDSPQVLREFTQNLLADLSSGAISVHEAFAAANQYAFLRQELSEASLILGEAAATGDEELTSVFVRVISQTLEKITALPNFQSQQPDNRETETHIREVAGLQKTATTRIRETMQGRPSKEKRRAFVRSLVERFSSTIPALSEDKVDALVERSVVAASRAPDAEQQSKFVQSLEHSVRNLAGGAPDNQKQELEGLIRSVVSDQKEYIDTKIAETKRGLAVYTALFGASGLSRPDVFADVVLNAPSTEKLDESLARAEKLARVAQSLEESAGERGGKLQFFSADGAKGIAGGLQKGADGILSLVGEPARTMLLHEKVNGTLRSMLAGTQQFADRLGESFVHSALFTRISQDLTKQLSQKPQAGGARNIVDDVFSSVFRGPLAAPLTKSTRSGILDFYELARANAAAPKGKNFLPPGVLPWEIYRLTQSGRVSAGSAAPRRTSGFYLPLLGAGGLGSLGSLFSNLFSSIVDRATSFTLLNPRLPGQLSASRRAAGIPTPLTDDMPLLVALVVIVVLVLLFIFPSPLNLNMINHSAKVSSLLATLQSGSGPGGGIPIEGIDGVTLSCANINGVHKYQNDPAWSAINCQAARPDVPACRPPTECTIGLSGCGSTSAAIILNSFGSGASVPSVWDAQHRAGGYQYYSRSCASYWSGVINILTGAGLSVFQVSLSEASNVLKECGLLLAIVDEKWSSGPPTGHIIVISGLSGVGGSVKATTLDPLRPPGYVSTVTDNPVNPGDIRIRGLFGVVR